MNTCLTGVNNITENSHNNTTNNKHNKNTTINSKHNINHNLILSS